MKKHFKHTTTLFLALLLAASLLFSGCGISDLLFNDEGYGILDILEYILSDEYDEYDDIPTGRYTDEDYHGPKSYDQFETVAPLEVIVPEAPAGKVYYPYYEALSAQKKLIYERLMDGIQKNVEQIPFDLSWQCTEMEAIGVFYCIYLDHPEFFWLSDEDYYYLDGDYIEAYEPGIFSDMKGADKIKQLTAKVESVVQGILNATAGMSDLDAERYFHDWLIKNVTYKEGTHDQSLYSAFVERKTVCAGYAKAFQYLCIRRGIECYRVDGTGYGDDGSSEGHTWNLIKINGSYYNVDVTWDDEDEGEPLYDYFNVGSGAFDRDHVRDTISERLPRP